MGTTDNLPSSSQMEDKVYSELINQPRIRHAKIASGGASVDLDIDNDINSILGFLVFASGNWVAVATHGLTNPVINGTDKKQIDFTGTAAAAYDLIIFYT